MNKPLQLDHTVVKSNIANMHNGIVRDMLRVNTPVTECNRSDREDNLVCCNIHMNIDRSSTVRQKR